jgi:hypothetical protein
MKKKPNKTKNEVVVNNIDKHQEELTDRLRHYNDWLMDDSRPIPSIYPGYPGDKKKPAKAKTVAPIRNVKSEEKVMKIETTGIKVSRAVFMKAPKPGSKQALANQIVQRIGVSNKHVAIETIMSEASMSKAGATTYFHNARHFLDSQAQATA